VYITGRVRVCYLNEVTSELYRGEYIAIRIATPSKTPMNIASSFVSGLIGLVAMFSLRLQC
jgi:hypothetical protein